MSDQIKPEKITKPIQLLAAWLLGLILINASFLTAASQIIKPDWASGLLVIACVVNVPLFLISIFLLQTKFRPEMQEDTYYSKYLERKYNGKNESQASKTQQIDIEKERKATAEIISKELGDIQPPEKKAKIEDILKNRDKEKLKKKIGDSRALSQLFLHEDKWELFVETWKKDKSFNRDIEELYFFDAIKGDINNPEKISLTKIGKEIAENLSEEKLLWNQKHKSII
ncbi:hypothetical protein BWK59_12825 [Flavobacterium davisii]|uniref:Uncharacterized protein n=1 Tax=Flavobacterium davisii TaxID=2906077 RepID=A0A246GFR6_9FLAO|nr:hypothetical protein [Flavobacterium davisii]OWP83000.1 hypothetical protein BWK59_12825 [Flavobacterium davisii]